MKTIPVIIPYFKAEKEITKCLSALEQQSYKPIEIFVRDNSSDNILFTAAVNEGLKKYGYSDKYDYVLILNQDAYVQRDTLSNLVECMERNPLCGIACPLQISHHNGLVYWGGSLEAFPFGRHLCRAVDSYQDDFETYWANGAAMLLRTSMVREIGLLDKNMRFICSDSDYSFTARSRGWNVIVSVKSRLKHSTGSSAASAADDFINQVKLKDTLYFANKWLTGDLYKQLSLEGRQLSDIDVRSIVEQIKSNIK